MTVYLLNPNSSETTTEAMAAIARAEAPQLSISGLTAPFGPAMIIDEPGLTVGAEAVAAMARMISERGDTQGVIVAAFGDPGIETVRALLPDRPVTGIGEASFAEAGADGRPLRDANARCGTPPLCRRHHDARSRRSDRRARAARRPSAPFPWDGSHRG